MAGGTNQSARQSERIQQCRARLPHPGVTGAEESERIMDAWAAVMERVSERVDHPISLLRIDSIVWQAGQVIGNAGEDPEASQRALGRHFAEVGLAKRDREALACEFTATLEHGRMR